MQIVVRRRPALVATAFAVGLFGGPAAGDAAAGCTTSKATAYDDTSQQNSGGTVLGSTWLAQSFTLAAPMSLVKVSLYLQNPGGPRNVVVDVRSDSGGNPGSVLGTRTVTLGSSPSFAFLEVDFSADRISLAQGTTYYVQAQSTDGLQWGLDSLSPTYAEGRYFESSNSGGNWSPDPSKDFLFQVFGQSCSADTPPGGGVFVPAVAAASNLGFSHSSFAAESSGPPATNARKKAPKGTTVSYTLNQPASVRFTVTQRRKGRKVKRRGRSVCAKPTRKNRKRKRCRRVVKLKGSFTRTGLAGTNRFHFTGRLNGRKLKPGRYRLVAVPNAGGKVGTATSAAFRIVR